MSYQTCAPIETYYIIFHVTMWLQVVSNPPYKNRSADSRQTPLCGSLPSDKLAVFVDILPVCY